MRHPNDFASVNKNPILVTDAIQILVCFCTIILAEDKGGSHLIRGGSKICGGAIHTIHSVYIACCGGGGTESRNCSCT